MNMTVSITPDEEGYTGKECPECEKYFKVKLGTGIPGSTDFHCPYCNRFGSYDEFWTKQQLEYARSVAMNAISKELLGAMKKMERKPDKNAFISIGITVKGSPTPIIYYNENELEEKVTCDHCSLEYAIYGSFGYCPDCGIHNSKQIINANFELSSKLLELSESVEPAIASKLVENALEDAISAFDGFGREHCSTVYENISFQNIERAKSKLLSDHEVDISDGLSPEEWAFLSEQFQKRHLLAHKMGIMDEKYCRNTRYSPAFIGRKVMIEKSDVVRLIGLLQTVVGNIYSGITRR